MPSDEYVHQDRIAEVASEMGMLDPDDDVDGMVDALIEMLEKTTDTKTFQMIRDAFEDIDWDDKQNKLTYRVVLKRNGKQI